MIYGLNENNEVIRIDEPFKNNLEDFIAWFKTLQIPKRKPRNIPKTEHDAVVSFEKSLSEYETNKRFGNSSFYETVLKTKMSQFRLPQESYENVYGDSSEEKTIKGKYAVYIHDDVGSYVNFKKNIEKLEKFFSSLKSFHKKALKNLTVRFVSAQDQRSAGKYLSGKKIMQVNPQSKKVAKKDDAYASLVYIVLHELGHKYLEENPQKWNINSGVLTTTKYSKVDSWNEEERFAELFALSHWKNKYPEYKEQINKFETNIK